MILNPGSAPLTRNIEDYPDGIIIPIDKPYRWTSADVIRKVKYAAIRHFGKKNLKVGHAGTLDPLATGVLLVCIGKATRLAEELQSHDKEYVAGITFGATTPSYDLEKEIDRFFPHEHINAEAVEAALPAFIGEQDQIAPLFSAKSIDGVRAYELARKLYRLNGGSDSEDPHLSSDRHPLAVGGMSSPSLSAIRQETGSEFDAAAESLIRVSRINISELELLDFERGEQGRRMESEDRATRGTEDGVVSDKQTAQWAFAASRAKRSGGVSEANVRASISALATEAEDRATRGTEAGGPQTKCSGGVSEANVRASISALATEGEDRTTTSEASSRINVTDNSALGLPRAIIRMACSKGTYVRAFARDLGEALGSGAHLDSLQRSRSGMFRVEAALSIEQAVKLLQTPCPTNI